MGLAGAYGGQTSIYGVNVRNHVVGCYAGRFERDLASPYVAVDALYQAGVDVADSVAVVDALKNLYSHAYPIEVNGAEIVDVQKSLIARLEAEDDGMRTSYQGNAKKIGMYFDAWFEGIGG